MNQTDFILKIKIKNKFLILFAIVFFTNSLFAKEKLTSLNNFSEFIHIKVTNPSQLNLKDVLISIPISDLKVRYPNFNQNAFTVFDKEKEIPTQTEDINGDGVPDNILIMDNFLPNESKTLLIEHDRIGVIKHEFKKRTQAELFIKKNYELKDGVYTGGRFESIKETEVPQNHFAHDALYKHEGPGWESDKVMYRFYLDSRNRNDIYGKKVTDVVFQKVGNQDLISDGNESYTKMCDWGMDVFKVGESLGIGSIGIWTDNKVNTISKTDKTICKILNDGIIESSILTNYYGWQVDSAKFDVSSLISISAGSRLSKEELSIFGSVQNICTGLAKHSGCSLITDDGKSAWGYIASYGQQSLAGDSLGLVIFYKKAELIKSTEDAESYIVLLKPTDGKLTYYFGSAWDREVDGITNRIDFIKYLNSIVTELSNPIVVEF